MKLHPLAAISLGLTASRQVRIQGVSGRNKEKF